MMCRACSRTLAKVEPVLPVCTRCHELAQLGARVLEAMKASFDDATNWETVLRQKRRDGMQSYAPEASDVFEQTVSVAIELDLLGEGARP